MATSYVYWLTFRIEENRTYDERYKALNYVIQNMGGSDWWADPTSFYVFKTDLLPARIASSIKAAIDETVDVVLFGKFDYKFVRIIGETNDQDVFRLVPNIKKL